MAQAAEPNALKGVVHAVGTKACVQKKPLHRVEFSVGKERSQEERVKRLRCTQCGRKYGPRHAVFGKLCLPVTRETILPGEASPKDINLKCGRVFFIGMVESSKFNKNWISPVEVQGTMLFVGHTFDLNLNFLYSYSDGLLT